MRTERRVAPAEHLRDVGAYARLLCELHPLYVGIEQRLEPFDDWAALQPPLDLRRRRRAALIADDLRALGVDAPAGDPRDVELPDLHRFAHAFGALYVIEGSRLGGRVLARQVSAAVGDAAEGALRFLGSDGSDAGGLWRELCDSLSAYAAQAGPRTRDAVVAGAIDTFGCFERRLARWEP